MKVNRINLYRGYYSPYAQNNQDLSKNKTHLKPLKKTNNDSEILFPTTEAYWGAWVQTILALTIGLIIGGCL